MKILLTGNCQVDGLHYFLSRALPKFEFRRLPHLATFYQEFSEERIAEDHAWADLVFFHHKHDHPQGYPTKQPKIPLSVWFQSAPFMAQTPQPIWDQLKESNADIEWIVKEADLDYEARWNGCWERMKEKEEDEEVPEFLRISRFMERGRDYQLQLTCNHPSSIVFMWWTILLVEFIGNKFGLKGLKCSNNSVWGKEAFSNLNLAGLPCEESATSGARKHLGLSWGGRPEDDESGRQICREKLL